MISNPVNFYLNSATDRDAVFTYEGGTKLYHFSPYDNNLSNSLENNVIFFANDEKHAKDILLRMFKFVVDIQVLKASNHKIKKYDPHSLEFSELATKTAKRFQEYIDKLDLIKVTEAPMNQFYKVGWACNDTLT